MLPRGAAGGRLAAAAAPAAPSSVDGVSSLHRAEARERARTLRPRSSHVRLDLRRAGPDAEFDAVTTLRFEARPGSASFVDLRAREIGSVTLNGRRLDADELADAGAGRIALPGLAADNELVVAATMAYSHDGEGLHPARRPGRRARVPLRDVLPRRGAALVRLLRPARSEGAAHPGRRLPAGVDGRRQRPGHPHRARSLARRAAAAAGHATPRPCWPARTTACGPSTTASRWCCTRAPRSPRTSTATPPSCSPTPPPAWTASTGCSRCATRGASTTRRSCPSSTPARWRTRAA